MYEMEVCGVIHLTSVECAVMVCYKASDRPKQTFTACVKEGRGILRLLLQDALFLPAIQSSLAVTAEANSNCDMSR